MIIKPFEIPHYILFKKTREKLFYNYTERLLDRVEREISRTIAFQDFVHPSKLAAIENINDNIKYLNEVRSDIIYFRLHGEMREKKYSHYQKYYKMNA